MTSQRKPQAFLLDGKPGTRKPDIEFVTEPVEHPLVVVPSTEPLRSRKRFRWLALLLSALTPHCHVGGACNHAIDRVFLCKK